MSNADLIRQNLTSPMVLCFALGVVARLIRSDFRLPEGAYTVLATYLLLGIGLKGGAAFSDASPNAVLAALALGCVIPLLVYSTSRGVARLDRPDAAALAAHYGSVSAVTFIASLTFLDAAGVQHPGFLPALVAVMEVPGIVVALALARRHSAKGSFGAALRETLTGKSIVLLAGGVLVGWAGGPVGYAQVEPFFVAPFKGALCVFMLDMGLLAASQLETLGKTGFRVVAIGLLAPVVLGALGVAAGAAAGLGVGAAAVLGVLSASASYIAAPAAVRTALPEANPSIYLTASIGLTFPFNLAVGIPYCLGLAQAWAG